LSETAPKFVFAIARTFFFAYICINILITKSITYYKYMTGLITILILMSICIAGLIATVIILVRHTNRQEDQLHDRNQTIVREVRRNQALIDKATSQGLTRSSLL
jgi:hypothetical protein